jgi:hypothetical protein
VFDRHNDVSQPLREQLNYNASIASLKESRLGIQQNQSVKRLTQLAFVFILLSFITSVFGMNITLSRQLREVVDCSCWCSDLLCHSCYTTAPFLYPSHGLEEDESSAVDW